MLFNFVFKDLGKTFVLRLENAVLHHKEAAADPHADATVTLTRDFWLKIVTKQVSITDLVTSDDLRIDGSRLQLVSFLRLLDNPNGNFAIVTP